MSHGVSKSLLVLTLAWAHSVGAVQITWDGETDADFLTGTNWNADVTPFVLDDAIIDFGGLANQPTLGAADAATVGSVAVSAGSLLIDGSLDVLNAFNLSGTGQATVGFGGTLTSGALFNNSLGFLSIRGFVDSASYQQGSGSTLILDSGALAPNSVLFNTGAATLGGALQLNLAPLDFALSSYSFDLISASSFTNDFTAFNFVGLNSAFTASTSVVEGADSLLYRLNLTRTTPTAVPEPGTLVLLAIGLAAIAMGQRRNRRRLQRLS